MTAAEQLEIARASLAGYRQTIDVLKAERAELAREAALDDAKVADWQKSHRRCVEQSALIADIMKVVADLEVEAKHEIERDRRESLNEQIRSWEDVKSKQWDHPMSAERMFVETLTLTPQWQMKVKVHGDRANHSYLTRDMVDHVVPTGCVQRDHGDECTDHRVTNPVGFRRWIAENATALIAQETVDRWVAAEKDAKARGQAAPHVQFL